MPPTSALAPSTITLASPTRPAAQPGRLPITLPTSHVEFADATWADIAPYFTALETVPVSDDTVDEWLAIWSRLEELVGDAMTAASFAYCCNTRDAAAEAATTRWDTEIAGEINAAAVRLASRATTFRITDPTLQRTLAEWKTDIRLFREANVVRESDLEGMSLEYQKITGGLTAEWEGQAVPLPRLGPFLESPDREVRYRAWMARWEAYLGVQPALQDVLARMVPLRDAVAREAGQANYVNYMYEAKHRDYTPAEIERFCDAIAEVITPAATRIRQARRMRLGYERYLPWDDGAAAYGAPLTPFRTGTELKEIGVRVLSRVDATAGAMLERMDLIGHLDLESRDGKAPGGFCAYSCEAHLPLIFQNAAGQADDVNTLLHEAGHGLHGLLTERYPLVWPGAYSMEAAELASMSMELLASPFLAQPSGPYTARQAAQWELSHLEDIVQFFPHAAVVTLFQHWLYTDGLTATPAARDDAWVRICDRFQHGFDDAGEPRFAALRYYAQLHIFTVPFYYCEYALAQLAALQVWRNAETDRARAVQRYRAALELGNTTDLKTIYQTAGADLIWDADGMRDIIAYTEARIAELRAQLVS
jgi:oligoendopeptidase F